MDKYSYKLFSEAKNEKDLLSMQEVYLINPDDNLIKYEYANLLAYNKQHLKAKVLLKEILDTGSLKDKNLSLMKLGLLEMKNNNYEEAKKYFSDLLTSKNEKDIKVAIYNMGVIEFKQQNYKEAKKYFWQLYNLGGTEKSMADVELGKSDMVLNHYISAKKHFKSAIQSGTEKDGMYARFELAKIYLKENKLEQVKEILLPIANLENKKSKSFCNQILGNVSAKQNNYDNAEKYFLNLLSLNNEYDNYYAIRLLIKLYIKKEEYEKALKYINLGLKMNIDIPYKSIFYVCKKLNVFVKSNYINKAALGYTENQVCFYDPYLAVEKIIDKTKNENETLFNSSVDVYKLFNEAKKYLKEENKLQDFEFVDVYLVKLKNIGANNENYLRITTLPSSNDIISMVPTRKRK